MENLLEIAKKEFKSLSKIENQLINQISKGSLITLNKTDEKFDATNPDNFSSSDIIRNKILNWLITDKSCRNQISSRGISIEGALIIGPLLFNEIYFPFRLEFRSCYFTEAIILSNSEFKILEIWDSCISGKFRALHSRFNDKLALLGSIFKDSALFDYSYFGGEVYFFESIFYSSKDFQDIPDLSGVSISLKSCQFQGSVKLKNKFRSYGRVNLNKSIIRGDLDCDGGQFLNVVEESYISLDCSNIIVSNDVFCSEGFISRKECRFIDAKIGGSFRFRNSLAIASDNSDWGSYSLVMDRCKIEKDLLMEESMIIGDIHLIGIEILGNLSFSDLNFATKKKTIDDVYKKVFGFDAEGEKAFYHDIPLNIIAEYIKVHGKIIWTNNIGADNVVLNLLNAETNYFVDDPNCWPSEGNLLINGFKYKSFSSCPIDVKIRVKWLLLQGSNYSPQPFEQLIKYYTSVRMQKEATKIAILKYNRFIKYGNPSKFQIFKLFILKITLGFGYKSYLSLLWLLGFIGLGALIFNYAFISNSLVSSDYKSFIPLIYSLDSLIPILDLNYCKSWKIVGNSFYQYYYIFHIAIGWFFTTMAVLGFSGIIKKSQ